MLRRRAESVSSVSCSWGERRGGDKGAGGGGGDGASYVVGPSSERGVDRVCIWSVVIA